MWTLAFGHHEDRTPTHGYAETRDIRQKLATGAAAELKNHFNCAPPRSWATVGAPTDGANRPSGLDPRTVRTAHEPTPTYHLNRDRLVPVPNTEHRYRLFQKRDDDGGARRIGRSQFGRKNCVG
jgi:hypothetical protein